MLLQARTVGNGVNAAEAHGQHPLDWRCGRGAGDKRPPERSGWGSRPLDERERQRGPSPGRVGPGLLPCSCVSSQRACCLGLLTQPWAVIGPAIE